jgi:putative endonuclease
VSFFVCNVISDYAFLCLHLTKCYNKKYYCGQTDPIQLRLIRHNSGEVKSTKHGVPWLLIKFIEVESRSASMKLEKEIKGRGIHRWLLENK